MKGREGDFAAMKIAQLKDNLWILGFIIAVLLVLNILIQTNSHRYYQESQPVLSDKTSRSHSVNNATQMLNSQVSDKQEGKTSPALNLRLLGTIIGEPSLAFISDLTSGKCGLYKLNGIIAGAKIVSITAGKVTLQRNGLRQELLLKDGGSSIEQEDELVIAAVSPGEMLVSKSGLISQMDRAKELLARVRIIPVSDDLSDKLKGFRINNVPSGSIIEQAGIKSGDLIYSVAGQRLESTQDALEIFGSVKNQSSITVDLLRDGKPITLRYEIRD